MIIKALLLMDMYLKYRNFSTELQPQCNRKCTALCIIIAVPTEHDLKTFPVTFFSKLRQFSLHSRIGP